MRIVEGGSWFYIKHLFTGVSDYYSNKKTLQEVKLIARQIMQQTEPQNAYKKLEQLAIQVGITDMQVDANDLLRIEKSACKSYTFKLLCVPPCKHFESS